jgi:ankyrin repeat protein
MSSSRIIVFSLLVSISLILSGCGRGKDAGESELVCIKQQDLRLVTATLNRETAGIEAALRDGADPNAQIAGLDPPVVVAAMFDDSHALKLLLDKGANVNARDGEKFTALLSACFNNNKDIVKLLLARGADVNVSAYPIVNGKRARFTALTIAKSQNSEEIVRLLTEAGAKE